MPNCYTLSSVTYGVGMASATGFFFPIHRFLPSQALGIISLIVLPIAIFARYGRHLAGAWRRTYVIRAMTALYLNFFILIVHLFEKVPALKAMAPTQSEAPFKVACRANSACVDFQSVAPRMQIPETTRRRPWHPLPATVSSTHPAITRWARHLFALIDHSGEAEKAGMKMRPTKLLIFGSPEAGTPVMLAAPSIAIDLPLKILIWEDSQGKVWVSYNSPAYLQERHGVPQDLVRNIAVVETLAIKDEE